MIRGCIAGNDDAIEGDMDIASSFLTSLEDIFSFLQFTLNKNDGEVSIVKA